MESCCAPIIMCEEAPRTRFFKAAQADLQKYRPITCSRPGFTRAYTHVKTCASVSSFAPPEAVSAMFFQRAPTRLIFQELRPSSTSSHRYVGVLGVLDPCKLTSNRGRSRHHVAGNAGKSVSWKSCSSSNSSPSLRLQIGGRATPQTRCLCFSKDVQAVLHKGLAHRCVGSRLHVIVLTTAVRATSHPITIFAGEQLQRAPASSDFRFGVRFAVLSKCLQTPARTATVFSNLDPTWVFLNFKLCCGCSWNLL